MKRLLLNVGFRGRLLLAMMTLVLVVSIGLVSIFAVSLFDEEEDQAEQRLQVAAGVTQEILTRRSEVLLNSLNVLVEDFGFKSAIASGDRATIMSALRNHTNRIGADLAMLTDGKGRLIANLQGLQNAAPLPFPDMLEEARQSGTANAVLEFQSNAYQLLMVPVEGGGLRAWLVMGFAMDDDFARFLAQLTGVDIAFRRAAREGVFAASLDASILQRTLPQSRGQAPQAMNQLDQYFLRHKTLSSGSTREISLLLLLSREQALGNYYTLALEMLLLVSTFLIAAALAGLVMARALGRPVLMLANFAHAVGNGEKVDPPETRAGGELRRLARALAQMQQQIRHREYRIAYDATHDTLTGLPNRKAFDTHIRERLKTGRAATVISLVVSDLKDISDTLGFEFGNEVMIATGLRLRGQLDPEDFLARTGGNEYTIVTAPMEGFRIEQRARDLKRIAERPTTISDTPVNIHINAAALSIPDDAGSLDDLRRRINLTMERARGLEQRTARYEEGGDEHHLRELRIIRDLQGALDQQDLYMVYQPQVDFQSVRLTQVEALLRWEHPELGFINPEDFIRLAESSGQIHELTAYILRQIEQDMRDWYAEWGQRLGMSINLSALDLTHAGLPELVDRVFADWPRPLNQLVFEITESAVLTDVRTATRTLEALRKRGARLSVDDFGTGYSSLAQLRRLPVQELKIDKSFILALDSEPEDQLMVRSIIDMAHGLNLVVVAEGIENETTWQMLQDWHCEMAQGFYLGRPMPMRQLRSWHQNFQTRAAGLQPRSASTDQVTTPRRTES
ncbi:diguanylate phosphodiesterase [Tamilnaduibacter salinus]|uniref:Diguanylate phosphodiesterase n=1 Tax=Tamilnaduibacter salinus TaxID=1484056 RepID=A0A2A2I594_9GAMM|nr:EAL domain-containing protein [Tamilnaduibacter salinus]PAV26909.1 diguanylate phosphodiesterase [Tamilnaduibacter salinus]